MRSRRKRTGKRKTGISAESGAFLCSSREITVCGCRKILHYAPDCVRLLLSDGIMEVCGKEMTAATYFGKEIRLSGRIENIKLCSDGLTDSERSALR